MVRRTDETRQEKLARGGDFCEEATEATYLMLS